MEGEEEISVPLVELKAISQDQSNESESEEEEKDTVRPQTRSSRPKATSKAGTPKREKQKQYSQKYRPEWEQLDFCRGWLQEHPGGNRLLAFCKVCDKALHARRNDLRKHAACDKHKKNVIYYERGTPVRHSTSKSRRFHPSLLDHPEVAGWLSELPGSDHRVWCRQCACGLTAQIKALKVHGQSRKHMANADRPPQLPPPPPPATSDFQLMDVTSVDYGAGEPSAAFASPATGADRAASPLVESDFSGRVTFSIGLGNRKVGFLGAGQIAQAIAQGMLEQGLLVPNDVIVGAPSPRNMAQWKRWKCRTTHNNDEVVRDADIIFLAVKTSVVVRLVGQLTPISDGKTRLFISVVPGVTRERISALVSCRVLPLEVPEGEEQHRVEVTGPPLHVIRCAPNKMMSISAGFCAYCMGDDVPHALYLVVETMFSALGTCIQVDETLMDAYSTMISSGAAFTCAFIESMVQGGVSLEMDWNEALKVASAVVSGTSKLLMRTSIDPSSLRKSISTPGSSTIAGLAALQSGGLDDAVGKAMATACSRTKEIGGSVCGDDM